MTDIEGTPDIKQLALRCRDAAQALAVLDSPAKDALLRQMADNLDADTGLILAANARDLDAARAKGIAGAMLDRLLLDASRVAAVAEGNNFIFLYNQTKK